MRKARHNYMITHLGRRWVIAYMPMERSWYARDDRGGSTGPFSTGREAEEWVREIRPSPEASNDQ